MPVFSKTFFCTVFINSSTSLDLVPLLFIKKLECFGEIEALPTLILSQPLNLIISQAFFPGGFLKVLPQVFICEG